MNVKEFVDKITPLYTSSPYISVQHDDRIVYLSSVCDGLIVNDPKKYTNEIFLTGLYLVNRTKIAIPWTADRRQIVRKGLQLGYSALMEAKATPKTLEVTSDIEKVIRFYIPNPNAGSPLAYGVFFGLCELNPYNSIEGVFVAARFFAEMSGLQVNGQRESIIAGLELGSRIIERLLNLEDL